jgi:hypothetical protein
VPVLVLVLEMVFVLMLLQMMVLILPSLPLMLRAQVKVSRMPFQCMKMGSCGSLSTAWHHSVVRSSQSSSAFRRKVVNLAISTVEASRC